MPPFWGQLGCGRRRGTIRRLLRLLLRLAHTRGQERLDLLVRHLLLALDLLGIEPCRGGRQTDCTLTADSDREEHLGRDGRGVGIHQDLEGRDKSVVRALLHTHTCPLFVFERTQVEGEGAGLLLDLREHLARRSHLEQVRSVGLAEDRRESVV